MDDTQPSRVSDAAAAASRKRRSSILKSQRPARTPFSELEFNVATPTDTAKSRRVSFSRRTGVAEFVTNEATTTWKNFYEEQNKSLESSSNDSEANASRQPVGHLGKRIFDHQFEEVEAVDFISGLANGSFNNANFSQQLGSLECTADGKLTAPRNKFELSAFTEQSKLFGNDFTAPSIGDNSGRIDINFSAIQQVGKDDLDEIEKDLERASSNMGCHGPFSNGQNMSEYIEVDLNMTHVVKNDEDMSITDTVHNPVEDVSKSASKDKKASLNDDWVADKENIAINPYAAPCETNFAINEEPDQVLVFDGKRLTLEPDIPEKDKNYRQTLLPNSSAETPQRKTIVLNVNDDLPNFIDDNNMVNSKYENSGFSSFQEIKADDDEISETVSVDREDIKSKRKTIHDYSGNISMTQALPTNIICHAAVISQDVNSAKRRTIVFNESKNDISMTEAIPVKLLSRSSALSERCRSVVYEDDAANISITQAVPSNILDNENLKTTEKRKSIAFSDKPSIKRNETEISDTVAVHKVVITPKNEASKRKTIVFDDSACNVSFSQALPANIMLPDKETQEKRRHEKRRTIIHDNDTGNISLTQALPTNIILPKTETDHEKRQTILYEDDTANVSVTQALPSNIILEKNQLDDSKKHNDAKDILTTPSLPTNITTEDCETSRRRPIVNETWNISITQAIPGQLILENSEENPIDDLNTSKQLEQPSTRNKKRTTIVYNNDEGDISMTEAIPANIIEKATNERNTIVCDDDEANISMTLAVSVNDYLLCKLDSAETIEKPEDIEEVKAKVNDYDVFEQDYMKPTEDALQDNLMSTVFDSKLELERSLISEISMTTEVQTVQSFLETEKRRTVTFHNDNYQISMTKPISAEFITVETEMLNETETKLDETAQNQASHSQSNIIVMQSPTSSRKQTINSNVETAHDSKVETAHDSKVELPIKLINDVKDVKSMASTDSEDQNIDKVFVGEHDTIVQTGDEERNESLIIASEHSYDNDTEDKSLMAVLGSNSSSGDILTDAADRNSTSGSMFYITKDCEAVVQTSSNVDNHKANTENTIDKEDVLLVRVDHLEKKLAELKSDVSQNSDLSNDDIARLSQISNKANETQNLLDFISNLTVNGDVDDKLVALEVKDQGETTEQKRLSVAPSRQSIALSREDLLNNISMAQAALQKCRLALNDSDLLDEDTGDVSIDISKNSGRASYEVVKTLNFDDESISETSKDEEKISPLKKTVFGETSYMKETKKNVIPTYLKDVSDGIKELMLDLVKPVSDGMPFQAELPDRGLLKSDSTHSTQVQVNLNASSQIDLDYELISNGGVDLDRTNSSTSEIDCHPEKSKTRVYRNQVKFTRLKETGKSEERHLLSPSDASNKQPPPSEVLIFDHLNPLNNVLLAPANSTDVHKYNPRQTDEMLCRSKNRLINMSNSNNYEVETVTTPQFTLMPGQSTKQENIYVFQNGDQFNYNDVQSLTSERTSVDQSVDATSKQLKDDEVNTLIAMRGNEELLQASSSLTLVDDLSEYEHSKLNRIKFSKLPVGKINGQMLDIDDTTALSGVSVLDSFKSSNLCVNTKKGKKRVYSPTNKLKYYSPSKEGTPKSIMKMKKISRSPRPSKDPIKLSPEASLSTQISNQRVPQSKNGGKKSPNTNNTKSGQTITVQELIASYHNVETALEQLEHNNNPEKKLDDLNPKSKDSTPAYSQSDASFTSSNNLKSIKDDNSTGIRSSRQVPMQDTPWQKDWHPELMGRTSSNLSEADSGVNVVAKIDMLPFMGSHECEWDSKSVADTWSFRLQHGRLRLTTRMAHRHDNATRTRVRGDTPVLDIAVETVQHDDKNPVATLCVRFTCETIRYMVAHALRTPCFAKDIPQLLRRCAAVTRVALRWGQAMHDAKLQLAYTMDNDGNISLKVANVRLRSVWEVTMHIELVVDDNRAVPWPKADGVHVTRVVSEVLVPDADVRRVLSNMPQDWGHAPRTIWRIFKYLKHKQRNDSHILA